MSRYVETGTGAIETRRKRSFATSRTDGKQPPTRVIDIVKGKDHSDPRSPGRQDSQGEQVFPPKGLRQAPKEIFPQQQLNGVTYLIEGSASEKGDQPSGPRDATRTGKHKDSREGPPQTQAGEHGGMGNPPGDNPPQGVEFPDPDDRSRKTGVGKETKRSKRETLVLTAQQEQMLFDKLKRGESDPSDLLTNKEFRRSIEAQEERWRDKWNKIIESRPNVLELIIHWNKGLVYDVASYYKGYATKRRSEVESQIDTAREGDLSYDDILNGGFEGLLKAIDNFDPQSGKRFSGFAYPRIIGSVQKTVREHLGISQGVMMAEGQAKRMQSAVRHSEGRETNEQELKNLMLALSDASSTIIENVLQRLYPEDLQAEGDIEKLTGPDLVPTQPELALDPSKVAQDAKRRMIRSLVSGKTEAQLAEETGLDEEQIRGAIEGIREELRNGALPTSEIFKRKPTFDTSQSHEANAKRLMDERFTDTEIAQVIAYTPSGVHSMRMRYEAETGRETKPITTKVKKDASISLIEAGLTNIEIREITGYSDAAIILHRREAQARAGLDEDQRIRNRERTRERIDSLLGNGLQDRTIAELTGYSVEGVTSRRRRLEQQSGEKIKTAAMKQAEEADQRAIFDPSQSRRQNMIRLSQEGCSVAKISELTGYPNETVYHYRWQEKRAGQQITPEQEQIPLPTPRPKTKAEVKTELRERSIVRGLIQQRYSDGEIAFLTTFTRHQVRYQRQLLFKNTGEVIQPAISSEPKKKRTATGPSRQQLRELARNADPELTARIENYLAMNPARLHGRIQKERPRKSAVIAFEREVAPLLQEGLSINEISNRLGVSKAKVQRARADILKQASHDNS